MEFSAACHDNPHIMIIDLELESRSEGNVRRAAGCGSWHRLSVEVRTTFNGEFPLVNGQTSEWHNGMTAAVVSKRA